MPRGYFTNLMAQRFGHLRVVGLSSRKPIKWDCVCDCGQHRVTTSGHLHTGSAVDCGRRCPLRPAPNVHHNDAADAALIEEVDARLWSWEQ